MTPARYVADIPPARPLMIACSAVSKGHKQSQQVIRYLRKFIIPPFLALLFKTQNARTIHAETWRYFDLPPVGKLLKRQNATHSQKRRV